MTMTDEEQEQIQTTLIETLKSDDQAERARALAALREHQWLEQGVLIAVDLQETDLRAADLHRASLNRTNLQGADLQSANLQGAVLWGTNLQGANLQDANLQKADLRGANLQQADLRGADLQEANLHSTNLQGTSLISANLQGVNLKDADLQDAELHSANLLGARGVTLDLLLAHHAEAGLSGLTLPDGTQLPEDNTLPLAFAAWAETAERDDDGYIIPLLPDNEGDEGRLKSGHDQIATRSELEMLASQWQELAAGARTHNHDAGDNHPPEYWQGVSFGYEQAAQDLRRWLAESGDEGDKDTDDD